MLSRNVWAYVIVAVAALGATVILAWHGTIDGQAAVGVIATVLAGGGAGAAVSTGVKRGALAATSATLLLPPEERGEPSTELRTPVETR